MNKIDETQIAVDESFDEAMTIMRDYLKRHEDLGPLALVSLARAVGLLTIFTSNEGRGDAIGTVINQMTGVMLDAMEFEHSMDEDE